VLYKSMKIREMSYFTFCEGIDMQIMRNEESFQ
jgi:hypothetical protein